MGRGPSEENGEEEVEVRSSYVLHIISRVSRACVVNGGVMVRRSASFLHHSGSHSGETLRHLETMVVPTTKEAWRKVKVRYRKLVQGIASWSRKRPQEFSFPTEPT